MPNDGVYSMQTLTTDEAVKLFQAHADNGSGWMENYYSAIGHHSTADALTELFGMGNQNPIHVARRTITMQPGDIALAFKPLGRLPEGKVLTREEIDEVGYTWAVIRCHFKTASDMERYYLDLAKHRQDANRPYERLGA